MKAHSTPLLTPAGYWVPTAAYIQTIFPTPVSMSLLLASCYLSTFRPEYRGNTFLGNVGEPQPDNTPQHPRRQYSLQSPLLEPQSNIFCSCSVRHLVSTPEERGFSLKKLNETYIVLYGGDKNTHFAYFVMSLPQRLSLEYKFLTVGLVFCLNIIYHPS